jgi:uncharacterized membrane protein
MRVAYLAVTGFLAIAVSFSGLMKIRRDPNVVTIIHDTIGVPLEYFAWLAACEFAGALGLVAGIWMPPLGIAAAVGLILYFVGATVSHLKVGDVKGLGPALFMLALSGAALAARLLTA